MDTDMQTADTRKRQQCLFVAVTHVSLSRPSIITRTGIKDVLWVNKVKQEPEVCIWKGFFFFAGGVLTVCRECISHDSDSLLFFSPSGCFFHLCTIIAPHLLMHTSFRSHSLSYIRHFINESSTLKTSVIYFILK